VRAVVSAVAGVPPEDHATHVERTLLEAQALIESTVSLHRQRPVRMPRAPHRDLAVPADAVEGLIRGARHVVCVALTGGDAFSRRVQRVLTPSQPGGIVRMLCDPGVVDHPAAAWLRSPPARCEVRVTGAHLRDVVIVDGSAALVRAAVGKGKGRATLVRDAAAVRALELLFAGAWSRGRRLDDHLALSPKLRGALTRRILERLRGGQTDETASRELDMSLRTYRRHVADLMRELNASSRFQAGVRAVELGLLTG
jgi:DNA-binding NarL/FixJ family response regulator